MSNFEKCPAGEEANNSNNNTNTNSQQTFDISTIPDCLAELEQWHHWQFVDGSKIPYRIHRGQVKSKSNDASTWSTLDEAYDTLRGDRQLAFELGNGVLVGVDLDNAFDDAGNLRPWAAEVLDIIRPHAYIEVSPSGNGLKAVLHGHKPDGVPCRFAKGKAAKQQVEIYDHDRFWAWTTNVVTNNLPAEPTEASQDAVDALCELLTGGPDKKPRVFSEDGTTACVSPMSKVVEQATKYVRIPFSKCPLDIRKERAELYLTGVNGGELIGEGHRDNTLMKVAGHLHHQFKLPYDDALAMLKSFNDNRVDQTPGAITPADIRRLCGSGLNNGSAPAEGHYECLRDQLAALDIDPANAIAVDVTRDAKTLEFCVTNMTSGAYRVLYYDSIGIEPPEHLLSDDDNDDDDNGQTNKTRNFAAMMDLSKLPVEYLVNGLFTKGQLGVIAGPSKSMKTTIATALALCLASGKDFLGKFGIKEPTKTLLCSAETSAASTAARLGSLVNACDIGMETMMENADNFVHFGEVPNSQNAVSIASFCKMLDEHRPRVTIIDPLYLTLDGDSMANVFKMGQQMKAFQAMCKDFGSELIFVHHSKKGFGKKYNSKEGCDVKSFEPMELTDMSGAGLAENVGSWMLVSRRKEFPNQTGDGSGIMSRENPLFLNCGNREGDGNIERLDITEHKVNGDGGPEWSRIDFKSVTRADMIAQEHADAENAKHEKELAAVQREAELVAEARSKLLSTLVSKALGGKEYFTKTQLERWTRSKAKEKALLKLQQEGILIDVEVGNKVHKELNAEHPAVVEALEREAAKPL